MSEIELSWAQADAAAWAVTQAGWSFPTVYVNVPRGWTAHAVVEELQKVVGDAVRLPERTLGNYLEIRGDATIAKLAYWASSWPENEERRRLEARERQAGSVLQPPGYVLKAIASLDRPTKIPRAAFTVLSFTAYQIPANTPGRAFVKKLLRDAREDIAYSALVVHELWGAGAE